ncbi:MAG TPA: MarR family winged helix-turn-helix transcriptional regulator [Candidatus Saccharimonadales bacterium]|nr:MarR family winged helix-turn-helix transcriptional regulator [Candidatus Saccharimonadales bacterium]
MQANAKQLPEDYVLVLQQINEDGGDGFDDLAEALNIERGRLGHIVQSLYHKGLIMIDYAASRESWMSLSTKGKRFVTYLWPESNRSYGY